MIDSSKLFDFRGVPRYFDLDEDERSKIIDNLFEGVRLGEPKQLSVTCDNERQKMLCEQVVRMCRGEDSVRLVGDRWEDASKEFLSIHESTSYRAKSKKELVVPWEYICDNFDICTVTIYNEIFLKESDGDGVYSISHLKLDLAGIDLPVTVKRPEGE